MTVELKDRWPVEPGRPRASETSQGLEAGGGSAQGPPLPPLPGRLRSALERALLSDEQVRAVIHGEGGSAMIGTNCRALVFKRGAKAGVPFSFRLKAFEYESVTSIAVRRTQSGAVLVIHAPLKIAACSSYWVDQRDDPWKARNAIPVKPPLERFVRFAATLGELVSDHQKLHGRVTSGFAGEPMPFSAPVPVPEPLENGVVDDPGSVERCGSCGAEVHPGWRYCPECGTASGTGVSDSWSWLQSRTRP